MLLTVTAFKCYVGEEKKKTKPSQRTEKNKRPKLLINIENKMKKLRKEISHFSEEIKRIKNIMKMTKRLWKNWKWIKKELNGKVTLQRLVTFKEKKINIIRKLSSCDIVTLLNVHNSVYFLKVKEIKCFGCLYFVF